MRKHYLDNIRWITVLLVILYHVIFMYAGVVDVMGMGPFRDFQIQDSILYFLYPWFMILLFVVSGVCARYELEKHTLKEFVGSRTRKLLVPSTIGLFVFQWILGWFSMKLGGAFEVMPVDTMPKPVLFCIMAVSGIGPLWYIQTLWLLSMVLALVRKCEKKGKLYALCGKTGLPALLLLAVPVWASAQILNVPVVLSYRFGVYGFCFFLGYFIFSQEVVLERLSKAWKLLTVIALLMGAGYTAHYFGESFYKDPVLSSPFSLAYGWLMVLAIFSFMYPFGNWDNRFTRFMNRESFGLYVFHYLPLSAAVFLIGKPQSLPAWLCYPILGISCIAGSILFFEGISRIPVIRWCVLGIKKEGKHVS